ncbi:MAG TPA: MFS transporter [Anaerolineaceae bacterium]
MITTSNIHRGWKQRLIIIWGGQSASLLGSNLVQFALIWYLTKTTGSATILVIASLMNLLPNLLLGMFAGALVDRWSRRRVMVIADGLVAAFSVLLAFLFWIEKVQIWHIYLILALRSIGGAFQFPAMQASITMLVPEKHLTRVAGWNQTSNGLVNIAGPALGAFLMSILPIYGVLAVDVITAALAITPLLFIPIPHPPNQVRTTFVPLKTILKDISAGLSYALSWDGMIALLGMAILVNFVVNPAYTLAPLLVTRIFDGSASHLGVINALWGIGAVTSGIILGIWGGFKRRIYTALMGVTGLGIGIILIGAAPASMFYLCALGMLITGLMNPLMIGSFFSILQASVPPEMQGRIITLAVSISSAATFLGMIICAPAADLVGIRLWYLAGGGLVLILGLVNFTNPKVREIEAHAPSIPARG